MFSQHAIYSGSKAVQEFFTNKKFNLDSALYFNFYVRLTYMV